jgi:hypothetical protein
VLVLIPAHPCHLKHWDVIHPRHRHRAPKLQAGFLPRWPNGKCDEVCNDKNRVNLSANGVVVT